MEVIRDFLTVTSDLPLNIEQVQKYFNLSYADGLQEKMLKMGNWKNSSLQCKILITAKDIAKKFRGLVKKVG